VVIGILAPSSVISDWFIFAIIGALIGAIVLLIGHIKIVNWVTKDCNYESNNDLYSNVAPFMVLLLPYVGIFIYLLIRSKKQNKKI